MWSLTGNEFSLLPDGTLQQKGRTGTWVCLNHGQPPLTYRLDWDDGKYIDTMTLNEDGNLMTGSSQNGHQLSASRVDGASNLRILPKSSGEQNRQAPATQKETLPDPILETVAEYRNWTNQETSSRINAVIVAKSDDSTMVSLMKPDGKVLKIATNILVPADQAIVRNWEKTNAPPSPRRRQETKPR
jgi:hypothetical protein